MTIFDCRSAHSSCVESRRVGLLVPCHGGKGMHQWGLDGQLATSSVSGLRLVYALPLDALLPEPQQGR